MEPEILGTNSGSYAEDLHYCYIVGEERGGRDRERKSAGKKSRCGVWDSSPLQPPGKIKKNIDVDPERWSLRERSLRV